jgi:hypothetical protein
MILCPRCGSDNVVSLSRAGYRRPKLVGRAVIRYHRCQGCAQHFRSYQIAPDPEDHEAASFLHDVMEQTA